MRRIAYLFLGLALVGAATWTWSCSADAPTSNSSTGGGGGPTGANPLQIRLFTSDANPVAGACTVIQAVVTLNGANVADGTGVSLSTDLANSFFSQNGLPLISVVTQGGTATSALCSTVSGVATVRANATVGSQSASATLSIAFQPSPQVAPFFSFCSPSFGPSTGGTTLTINGGRFFGDTTTTRATFNAAGITREALITGVTATAVTLVTPAFPEATSPSVPVNITLTFGTKSTTPATLSVPNCFAYGTVATGTPTITAVLPSSGSNAGNTRVTIIGSGFVKPVQVFFGPVEAQVLSVDPNQIVVLTPPASGAGLPNLNQTVTVRVHEVNSGIDATKDNAFRFVTAIQITAIDNNQQRVDQPFIPVTIHGQGFLSPVAVTLAGIPAKVISVSATELLVLPGTPFVPPNCADISGATVVTNIDSGASATGPSFTYLVAQSKAVISSVSPNSGAPGTSVTISGSNLGNVTTVTFGPRAASIISVSPTTIVVIAPDSGATPPACPAGTPAGTPINVGGPVDVTVTSALTGCSTSSPGAFQYRLPCVPGADLSITKAGSPNPVTSGATLTYAMQVNNAGPNAADNVVVTDQLPVGQVTFLSCAPANSCSESNGIVTANFGTIQSPGFAILAIQVRVDTPGPATITNTAVVSSSTPDPSTGNNLASTSTTVSPSNTQTPTVTATPTNTPTPTPTAGGVVADLALSKTGFPGTVLPGGTVTYALAVTNSGPNTASGVVMTDHLPAGTTFQSCSVSQGSCLGPAVGTPGPVDVVATFGTVATGSPVLATIVATVTAPAGSMFTNVASVTSSSFDPNPLNNTASTTTTVSAASADLSLTKSAPSSVLTGDPMTYTILVTNNGPNQAVNVQVSDPLPAGADFVSCDTTLGSCSFIPPSTVRVVAGDMGVSGFALIHIMVTVTAPGGTNLVDTALCTSDTPDPNLTNNTSSVTTIVNP